MSTTHAKGGLDGTRQLLDELDALMNQMLALPVDGSEETAAPVIAQQPTPTVAATLTLLEPRRQPTPSDSSPPAALDVAATGASTPAEPYLHDLMIPAPTKDLPAMSVLQHVAAPDAADLTRTPHVNTTAWKPERLAYRLFRWTNRRFDAAASRLGKAGAFLRSRLGKALLALCGIALLLGAFAWLWLDWLGWNS